MKRVLASFFAFVLICVGSFFVASCRGSMSENRDAKSSAPPVTASIMPVQSTAKPDESKKQSLNLYASPRGKTGIGLAWNYIIGADEYIIYRSESADGEYQEITRVPANGRLIYYDELLTTGTQYHYKVSAYTNGTAEETAESGIVMVEIPEYDGYENIEGTLYRYDGNNVVRNTEIDGIYFDEDGRYTTGIEELDNYLRTITAENTDDGMSQLEKFEVLYDWVIENFEYGPVEYIDTSDKTWELDVALNFFREWSGNCFSYAAAVSLLGRNIGMQTESVYGSCYQQTNWVMHSWTEVIYGGELYFCDAEMEGVYSANRDLGWDLFMKQYGETPTEYIKD